MYLKKKNYPLLCETTHLFIFLSWSIPSSDFSPGSSGQRKPMTIYMEAHTSLPLPRAGNRMHVT